MKNQNDSFLSPRKPEAITLRLSTDALTPEEAERRSRIEEALRNKKREDQLRVLRDAVPEPEVQTFRKLYFTHEGMTMTLTQWARHLGLSYGTLKARYKAGKRGDALFCMNPYVRVPSTPAPPPEYFEKKNTPRVRIKPIETDENGTPIITYDPTKTQED